MTADHRETIVAALTRLGMLLVAEEVPCRGVPGQLIRYVNEHWPTDDGGEELRRQPDAALERGNRLAVRLAEIEPLGVCWSLCRLGCWCVPVVGARTLCRRR